MDTHNLEALGTTLNNLDDNLPKGTTRCFNVGSWGGCGLNCPVFQDGECKEPQEFTIEELKAEFTDEEVEEVKELYPKIWE